MTEWWLSQLQVLYPSKNIFKAIKKERASTRKLSIQAYFWYASNQKFFQKLPISLLFYFFLFICHWCESHTKNKLTFPLNFHIIYPAFMFFLPVFFIVNGKKHIFFWHQRWNSRFSFSNDCLQVVSLKIQVQSQQLCVHCLSLFSARAKWVSEHCSFCLLNVCWLIFPVNQFSLGLF